MIDLHTHILPGLDDGAKDMDEAIAMCFVAVNDGIHTIVATPHTGNGNFNNHRDEVAAAVLALNTNLKEREVSLEILPGADNAIHERLDILLQNGEAMTVNDNKKYVMVEFPRHIMPPNYIEWMFRLKLKGITPVFTHPERNTAIQRDTQIVRKWVENDGLVQITAMSITGSFGPDAKKCSDDLLKHNLVHVIASDAHSATRRPPVLSEAIDRVSGLIGKEATNRLVHEFPAAIIAGEAIEIPEPIRKKTNFFMRFFAKC